MLSRLLDRLAGSAGPADDLPMLFSRLPRLETERLLLRPAVMGDAEDIYAYASDPEVARAVLWEAHRSLADSRDYIRYLRSQYHSGQPSNYVIVLRETGRVIGTIGFMQWYPEHGVVEVGYSIGRAWWGQGIAAEALRRFLALCFAQPSILRVEAMHETDNPASGRVMEKCGMRREGVLRQRISNKGRQVDVALWAILRDDWLCLQHGGAEAQRFLR